ncbi:hypothetical protein V8F20_010600 [Naviculisporaceae sp. PSN 640]
MTATSSHLNGQSPPPTPFWLQILLRISLFTGWFQTRLQEYSRLIQETDLEATEEKRLLASEAAVQDEKIPTTFPQFSQLPAELRHMIWAEALPSSRVLMLQAPTEPTAVDRFAAEFKHPDHRRRPSNVWTCTAKIPSILHVNSEARAIALKHYQLGLAPGCSQPRIYVDLERDIIGVSNDLLRTSVGRNLWRLTDDLKKVRHLALASDMAAWFLESKQTRSVLEKVQHVAIVYSALWGKGTVPKVAQSDWNHWIRWQCAKGTARWSLGGYDEYEVGDGNDSGQLSAL